MVRMYVCEISSRRHGGSICQEEACKKASLSLQLSALIETLSACARKHTLLQSWTPRLPSALCVSSRE